ncbi:MFS transporter [Pseudomonas sp. NPDC088444]|uniref:MFS transporter n=1 Tax=Pseudomonas sp. NPDC088444 TaxID=3364456 RepID=UPI0038508B81
MCPARSKACYSASSGNVEPRQPPPLGYRLLFTAGQATRTVSLALALFLIMFSFYFITSWTPVLLTQSGFSEKDGAAGGVLLNLGGMLGALLMGLSANRFGCARLLPFFLLVNAVLMTLMVPATHLAWLAVTMGVSSGLLLYGAIAGLFTLAPQGFATAIRTRGVGFVLATGRVGAILSPPRGRSFARPSLDSAATVHVLRGQSATGGAVDLALAHTGMKHFTQHLGTTVST